MMGCAWRKRFSGWQVLQQLVPCTVSFGDALEQTVWELPCGESA